MFRFTIRDVLWLTVVVALILGWFGDRRSYVVWYYNEMELQKKRQRDNQKKVHALYEKFRSIEEDYEAKYGAAINREEELKTTVKALKLRLGEDPYAK
jgi:hypothetical protein